MLSGHHELPGALPRCTLSSSPFLDAFYPVALDSIKIEDMLKLSL